MLTKILHLIIICVALSKVVVFYFPDLDIDKPYLNVSSNVFDPRNDIDITCSAQKTDPHSLINFYVDYVKVML